MPTDRTIIFRQEYFLFLLPLFFVFHGYADHFPLIRLKELWPLLLVYLAATLAISLVFYLVFRSWRKAFIMTLALMAFQIFFGTLHDLAKSILPFTFLVKYVVLLPLLLTLFIVLLLFLKRSRRKFDRLVRYANLVLVLFLLLDAAQLIWKSSRKNGTGVGSAFHGCDSCAKPDIYLILADEYAGHRELQDIFDFDNTPFENALRERGFHVVESATGNYNYTPFCMASLFSMDYLTGIEGRNQSPADRKVCYRLINRNEVTRFLEAQGYELVNLSVFQFADELPTARSSFFLTGKELMTSQTFLSRLDRDLRFHLITRFKLRSEMARLVNRDRQSMEQIYRQTVNIASTVSEKPRFVYTHLMMPHYPYLYDRNGRANPPENLMEGEQGRKKEYIEYLQYANKKYLELVDHIRTASRRPAVILLLSDHGFRHFTEPVDPTYHFMNLNAVYLPGGRYEGFYKGMSAVNEFRVLFNTVFGQRFPMQKDSLSFLRE